MKLYGSLSRLVSILFRKDSQDITLRPNQGTTYTAARDIQLPPGDAAHVLASADSPQAFTNKTIDADLNTISNIENADIKAGAAIDATKIHDGSVSNTEFGYIGGLTSDAQTQLTNNANATSAVAEDVGHLVTLSGVAVDSDDLGTFTGSTIPDASDIKEALQALETAVEAATGATSESFTWTDGSATKSCTHSFSTSGVLVEVVDQNGETVLVDTIDRFSSTQVDLTRSEATVGGDWTVIIRG